MKNIFKAIVISVPLVLWGCGGNSHSHDDHDHEGHDHSGEVEASGEEHVVGEIIFTQEQAAHTDFALMEVEPVTFSEIITAGGQILAAQGDEATIVASVSGVVSFGAKKISEGAAVGRNETLFHISTKDIAEGDYYTRVVATYEQAKAAYERNEKLIADRLVSQSDFEQSKLAYDQARIAYEAVVNKTSAQGIGVAAPIAGFVKNIYVNDGQYVEVGQALGVVSQNRRLVLRAEVSQKYYEVLRTVSTANFRTPYDNQLYSLKDMGGRLLSAGKSADGGSAFIPVTFEFDNKGDVVQGAFVEVFLVSSPQNNVIAIPAAALIEEQGVYSVFVQFDEEGYLKREVKIGATDGRDVRIFSGLEAGETIVARGAQRVKSASASAAIPHGHTH